MTRPSLVGVQLEGEHVALEPICTADAHDLFPQIHERDAVLRWLIWTGPETIGELERRFAEWHVVLSDSEYYMLAVRERGTRALCGTISLRFFRDGRGGGADVDLGYWLGPDHWGKGFGTEAVGLCCWLAFEFLGASRAVATVFVGNVGSRAVLERNGFRLEDTLRDVQVAPERSVDEWLFRTERAQWETVGFAPVHAEVEIDDPLRHPGAYA